MKSIKKEAINSCSQNNPEIFTAYVKFESDNPERKKANLILIEQERILKTYLFGSLPKLIISQFKEEKIEENFQNQPLLSSNVIATQKILSILQALEKINFNNIVSEKVSQPDIDRIINLIQKENQKCLLQDIRYECKIARNMHNLRIIKDRSKIEDDLYSIVICYNEDQKDTVQEKLKMKKLDSLIGNKIFILKLNYEK